MKRITYLLALVAFAAAIAPGVSAQTVLFADDMDVWQDPWVQPYESPYGTATALTARTLPRVRLSGHDGWLPGFGPARIVLAIRTTWHRTDAHIPLRRTQVRMKNVDMTVEGNILTIRIDLAKEFGESKSGKSITIASSEGNVSVPDHEEIKIGLNIYRKK